jgi:hypothetical protein
MRISPGAERPGLNLHAAALAPESMLGSTYAFST